MPHCDRRHDGCVWHFYALTADGYDYPEMYDYAKYIRRELLDVKGVKRINIVGNRDEVINIILSKEQIARNGIVPTQIISALQSAGKMVNAGKYHSGDERIALYVDSSVENEEDIRNLLIQTMDGKRIRIGDIARVGGPIRSRNAMDFCRRTSGVGDLCGDGVVGHCS